jgi:hypothetical protein
MDHRSLVLLYRPCIPEQITDNNRDQVNNKCSADYDDPSSLEAKKEQSLNYVKRPTMMTLSNQADFNVDSYN